MCYGRETLMRATDKVVCVQFITTTCTQGGQYLIVDWSAFCLTASSMKVTAAVWLCFSRIWSIWLNSGWSEMTKKQKDGMRNAAVTTFLLGGTEKPIRVRLMQGPYTLVSPHWRAEWKSLIICMWMGPPVLHQPGVGWRGWGVLCLFV